MTSTDAARVPGPGPQPAQPRLLEQFAATGMFDLSDTHVARRLIAMSAAAARSGPAGSRPAGEDDELVELAAALCVRALRHGSVCVDLHEVDRAILNELDEVVDGALLPWPQASQWLAACAGHPLVDVAGSGDLPLRLVDNRLYLQRYWQLEESVRADIARRNRCLPDDRGDEQLRHSLARVFGDGGAQRQRLAAAVAALRSLCILAGGPGTGKTTAVAGMLAVIAEIWTGELPPRIACAAPTGKAATRLAAAIGAVVAGLPAADSARLGPLPATTIHRLLGWLPSSRTRFRHDRDNPLPHDVVVIDEASMVSLPLMARLLEALRPEARLILVGDPDQLASVDAGAVLSDLVAADGQPDPMLQRRLAAVLPGPGAQPAQDDDPTPGPVVNGVVTLHRNWRFGGRLAQLGEAIRDADAESALGLLADEHGDLQLVEASADQLGPDDPLLAELRAQCVRLGAAVIAAARAGDARLALGLLDEHRLLCAHRAGPFGVDVWGARVARWLRSDIPGYPTGADRQLGRPLLMTGNDYSLGLFNGDSGVIVAGPHGEPAAAFARGTDPLLVAPSRLERVQTMHAMTIHRTQGSQFDSVTVVLPPAQSPLATRELLYTAVTRARSRVRLIGTREALEVAVSRSVSRASGLRRADVAHSKG